MEIKHFLAWVFCILLIIIEIFISGTKENNLQDQINKLKIVNCGLIQYEDYSVGPQKDDTKRIKCVLKIEE